MPPTPVPWEPVSRTGIAASAQSMHSAAITLSSPAKSAMGMDRGDAPSGTKPAAAANVSPHSHRSEGTAGTTNSIRANSVMVPVIPAHQEQRAWDVPALPPPVATVSCSQTSAVSTIASVNPINARRTAAAAPAAIGQWTCMRTAISRFPTPVRKVSSASIVVARGRHLLLCRAEGASAAMACAIPGRSVIRAW